MQINYDPDKGGVRIQQTMDGIASATEKFLIVGNYLVQDVGHHTCGAGGEYGHEPYCGLEPVGPVDELLLDPLWFLVIEKLEPELSDPASRKST